VRGQARRPIGESQIDRGRGRAGRLVELSTKNWGEERGGGGRLLLGEQSRQKNLRRQRGGIYNKKGLLSRERYRKGVEIGGSNKPLFQNNIERVW